MPRYDYQCDKCLTIVEEVRRMADSHEVRVHSCGGQLVKLVSLPQAEVWQTVTLENLEAKPLTFTKKSDLIKYCREHQVSSGALL